MSTWRAGKITGKKRMWLDFPFDIGHRDSVKNTVPGARWDAKNRFWTFPLDVDVAQDLLRVATALGCKLMFEPELATWIKSERKRYSNLIKPDDLKQDVSKLLPNLRANYPSIIEAMENKPWQIPATAFMAAQGNVLLADKPGLGKTLDTIGALLERDVKGPILIVAPRSAVRVTWPGQIRQWIGPDETILTVNAEIKPELRSESLRVAKLFEDLPERCWVLLGPNYLRIRADTDDYGNFAKDERGKKIVRPVNEAVAEVFGIKWSAVVVDESHQSLAGGSGGVGKRRWSAQRLGLDALTLAPNAPRIAISGTPFRGKTENLWGTLNWLDRKRYSSYWNWIRRHYGVTDQHLKFGPKEIDRLVQGDSILDEKRFYAEIAPYMIRRTKEEVALMLPKDKRLPPKIYEGTNLVPGDPNSAKAVWLPLLPQQKKQYDRVTKEALLYIDDLTTANVNGCLAEMTRFKQIANSVLGDGILPAMPSNKVDWIVDFLKDRQESGTKVIVASQFTGFLNMMSRELNKNQLRHYMITGETNDDLRESQKLAFQSDTGDLIFLINTKAGGVSIDLDYADDVVICDQTWIPDDQEQVEDRAHRPNSRIHQVTVWYLASLGTIDEDIAIVNNERNLAMVSIMDYQREVFRMTKARQLGSAA